MAWNVLKRKHSEDNNEDKDNVSLDEMVSPFAVPSQTLVAVSDCSLAMNPPAANAKEIKRSAKKKLLVGFLCMCSAQVASLL